MKGSLQRLETKPFPLEREWTVEGVPVLRLSGTLPQPVGKPSSVPRRVQRFYQHQARCYLSYCQRFLLPLAEEAHRAALAATLDSSVRAMAAAFELADFGPWRAIIESVVYEGLYAVGAAVLNGTFRKGHRRKQRKAGA